MHDWLPFQGPRGRKTPPHQDNVNICTTDGGMAEVRHLTEEVVMTTASSKATPSRQSNIGTLMQAMLGY